MKAPRQTFVVHVLQGGPRAVVERVASRERRHVPDIRDVGAQIARWIEPSPRREPHDTDR